MSENVNKIALEDAKIATAVAEPTYCYRVRSTKRVEVGKKFNDQTKTTEVQYQFIATRLNETIQEVINIKPKSIEAFKSRDIGHAINVLEILMSHGLNCKLSIGVIVNENKTVVSLNVTNLDWNLLHLPDDFFVPKKYRMH